MQRLEFKNFKLLGNITREIQTQGIAINELGSDVSQALVIAKHIEHAFVPGNILLDRCILDGLVYTKVLNGKHMVSDVIMHYAYHIFDELSMKYDVIFYVEPTLPLQVDGIRSLDADFFANVVSTFEEYLRGYFTFTQAFVVRIAGSREERVQKVLATLKERKLL